MRSGKSGNKLLTLFVKGYYVPRSHDMDQRWSEMVLPIREGNGHTVILQEDFKMVYQPLLKLNEWFSQMAPK